MEAILISSIGAALGCLGLALGLASARVAGKMKKLVGEAVKLRDGHYARLHALASTPLDRAELKIYECSGRWRVFAMAEVIGGGYVSGIVKDFTFADGDEQGKEYARRCAEELVEKIQETI